MSSVEFLLKLRDAAQMMADAANEYLERLAPPEVRETDLHEEPYEELPWEDGEGSKGPYQMATEKDNEGQQQLFNDLRNILKRNNGRFTEKSWRCYYWLGSKDDKIIFRRKKKRVN